MAKHFHFVFLIPQTILNAKGNKEFVGDLEIHGVANLYNDRSLKSIDFEKAIFQNGDCLPWVSVNDPEIFEEWNNAAESHLNNIYDVYFSVPAGAIED